MAKIHPFRGVMYSSEKFGKDLTDLVTQPYDKITDEMREEYYSRHPQNFIRVVLGRKFPSDDEYYNYYVRSAGYLQWWLEEKIMVSAEKPAIYAYHQVFEVEGQEVVRKGFVALAELEPPGKGVKAHEKTLAGPKADRLNLTRHIRAQVGHIFMLYSDPQKVADEAIESAIASREPDFIAKDWFGNEHRMWKITDENTIRTVQSALADKTLFIADGHHRYETAVNYWKECEGKGLVPEDGATEIFSNRMMTFVNMDDPGLVILPTHRVVHSVENFDVDRIISRAEKYFDIEKYAIITEGCVKGKFQEAMTKMEMLGEQGKHSFVFVPKNAKNYYLLTLKDERIMDEAIKDPVSADWKRLDVSILHKLLLEDILGIDAKALEEKRNLYYIREREKGFEYLEKDPKVQGVFYLNATKIEEVKKIASAGERMPQKSTDFYPKLLTGMVINKLRFK
ncbi:DUF1015 domain-containing protein [bacterium]|nr:DUF1015 domain-containing protein [bacterium]